MGEVKKDKKIKKKNNWAFFVTFITFFIALFLGFFSDILSKNLNIALSLIVLVVIIFIGIIFDIIGVAVAAADERPINAMAARKIKGAKQALKLIQNADKATNICNDVIGDVAGIISGTTSVTIGAYLLKIISEKFYAGESAFIDILVFSCVSAAIAALTIGGKAAGKKIAIDNASHIVFYAGKIISAISFKRK